VKAARFEYHAPTSVDEAVQLLASFGDDAKVLGGGQSLVPMLGLRLTRFAHLVDLNKIPELSYIETGDGVLSIGAMTRQASAEHSSDVATSAPLLAKAIPHIGHFQIRNRGTIGGSIAHADPASELPTVARVLDAEIEVAGVAGTRRIPADEFFVSMWETALENAEIVVAIHVPVAESRSGFGFEELALRPGDFALAGAAVSLVLDDEGAIRHVRIGLLGMDATPVRAREAESSLLGKVRGAIELQEIGRLAVSAANPTDDVHASANYRITVGAVLVERALVAALEEAARG
jgi:carbon-monoxide dehydrogenase medium subunit